MSLSFKDVLSSYSTSKKNFDATYPWMGVIRSISFFPSWIFVTLGISANQTTILSIIVGLIGSVFLFFGQWQFCVIGSLFVNLFLVLDCVDGNIARTTKTFSLKGKFLDRIAAGIVLAFMYQGIGVGLYFNEDDKFIQLINNYYNIPIFSYIFLGIVASVLSSMRILIEDAYQKILTEKIFIDSTIKNIEEKNIDIGKEKKNFSQTCKNIFYFCERNINDSCGFIFPLLFIGAVFNVLSLLLIFYTLFVLFDYLLRVWDYARSL